MGIRTTNFHLKMIEVGAYGINYLLNKSLVIFYHFKPNIGEEEEDIQYNIGSSD